MRVLSTLRRRLCVAARAVERASDADLPFLAAGIAYYWLVSVVPMAAIGFAAIQWAYGDALVEWAVALVSAGVTTAGEQFVREAVASTEGVTGVAGSGVLALGWSWSRAYRGVDHGFDRVHGGSAGRDAGERVVDAFVAVPALVAGLALSAVGVLGPLDARWTAAQFVATTLIVLPAYVRLSRETDRVRGVLPGATLCALAWTALRGVVGLYAVYGGYATAYGVLGGVLLAVVFLYLGAASLLAGAALNAERVR